ncbi:MAG TPA: ABC transporter permease [Anaerolineales bacterium]|jgi:lipopolysaccharide transport system permease protein
MTEITKSDPTTVYIRPSSGFAALNLGDLWHYRELIVFMIWRDIKVRYKQTLLGALWAVIQPVMTMLVFNFLFNNVAKVSSDGIPYPIFSFTALLPWGLFTTALNTASRSLTSNHNMITKTYFPRLVLPMASVLGGLVDFGIAFVILAGMMVYYHVTPTLTALWAVPLFVLLAIISALGVALWLSAINVQYRDVGYALPFITQFWLFITPVAYSSKVISEKWQLIYALNPMAGVVNGFRWALLGSGSGPNLLVAISTVISLVILFTGLVYFRNMERTFADTI